MPKLSFFITVLGSIHMLWISSVVVMLLGKDLPEWHRTLNILAPLFINGVIVLVLLLCIYLERSCVALVGNWQEIDPRWGS